MNKKKILFFQWNALIQKDVEEALKKRTDIELDCISYEFADWDNDGYFERRFPEHLLKKTYDMVFSINFFPVLSDLCNKYCITYVSWVYDAPMHIKRTESIGNPCNRVFVFDKGQYKDLRAKGFDTVFHMPLGVNSARLENMEITLEDVEQFSSEIAFVGKLYENDMEYLLGPLPQAERQQLLATIENQKATYGNYMLNRVLTDEYVNRLNVYYRSASNGMFQVKKEELEYAMATYITQTERLEILERLSRHRSMDLYSYNKPEGLERVNCKGFVKYYREMPKVFRLSKINLNISLKIIKEGIPLRVFDILGAGGFLITNYQPELEECFEIDKDLVVYENLDDLQKKVDYYLTHEEERNRIARHGHETVAKKFTIEQQLDKILSCVDGKQSCVDKKQSQADGKQRQMDGKQNQMDGKQSQVDGKQSQMDEKQSQMDGKQSQMDEKQSHIDEKQRQVDEKQPIKVMIPIRANQYPYQYVYASKLQQAFMMTGCKVSILNLDLEQNPLYLQTYMNNEQADLLVTIDGVGFELDMLGDDLYYNSLCIPAMHFVTCYPWQVATRLSHRMNFTMEIYTMYEQDTEFLEKHIPNTPKIQSLPDELWESNMQHVGSNKEDIQHQSSQIDCMASERNASLIYEQIASMPEVFSNLAKWIIEQYTNNPEKKPWELLEQYLQQLQFEVSMAEFYVLLEPVELAYRYVEMKCQGYCWRDSHMHNFEHIITDRFVSYLKKELERIM